MTSIPPDTIAAFYATRYGVDAPGGSFVLSLGEHSEPLATLLAAHRAVSAVYLTAWNPRSTQVDAAGNARAQVALADALAAHAAPIFEG